MTEPTTASRLVSEILRTASDQLDSPESVVTRDFLTNLRSLPDFVFEVARTLDEHDDGADGQTSAGKPFPDWPYLHDLVDLYVGEKHLLVEKARQLMATWLFAAVVVWEVRSKPGQRWGWISLKEGHADAALERMWQIIENMPGKKIRTQQGAKSFIDAGGVLWQRSQGRIYIPSMHCNIHAMSQAVDDARSFTFSGFVADETAFQPNFRTAYGALKPTIDSGRFVSITTPGPFGFVYDLYHGKSFEDIT